MQQNGSVTHQSLEKALKLMTVFIPDNRELGTVELAEIMGLHRSTASRLLSVLKLHGYLRQNPENRKYSIGPTVADLATAYRRSFQTTFLQIAKPQIDELRNEVGQTAILEVPSGDRTVLTYVAEGFGSIRIKSGVGDRHHFHTSAGGKSILAFSKQEFIDDFLSATPAAVTSQDSGRHPGPASGNRRNPGEGIRL